MRKTILVVIGTRPEAIKMAPVYLELAARKDAFAVRLCITAQHREMLDSAIKFFGLQPDYDLDVMRSGQRLSELTARILQSMTDVLQDVRPDVVLVHGDTTTTLAAAVAAFYEGIAVGHVEAGLRTHDMKAPFPEEFNRQLVSRFARLHFAPTESSRQNLLQEGIDDGCISVTGNTVIDALHWTLTRMSNGEAERLEDRLQQLLGFDLRREQFVLITGHRRENFGDGLDNICSAVKDLARCFPRVHFVYPVHLNPRVQGPVRSALSHLPNVHLIEPIEYQPFVSLMSNCFLVLTDSGGIQEEAPSLGKPVLVMRDVTERPEAVTAGTVKMVGSDAGKIFAGVSHLLTDNEAYEGMSRAHNPYGDGKASQRIVDRLCGT